jgi:hypothetical protein
MRKNRQSVILRIISSVNGPELIKAFETQNMGTGNTIHQAVALRIKQS